ncbi:hypothetical protein Acr_00g0044870 [Actinidia rufa]|uniref:Uncharacterized protein n=1 Tax=Actinidia rufa TaxID=165716 RepID=A0A7J0DJ76_9ERIC|nr:hypothetical protein Acr_00g0044870 [Actinidia rufa]
MVTCLPSLAATNLSSRARESQWELGASQSCCWGPSPAILFRRALLGLLALSFSNEQGGWEARLILGGIGKSEDWILDWRNLDFNRKIYSWGLLLAKGPGLRRRNIPTSLELDSDLYHI